MLPSRNALRRALRTWRVVAACALGGATTVSCADEVLQTAVLGPDDGADDPGAPGGSASTDLECDAPPDDAELPAGAEFGSGEEIDPWIFAAGDYAVSSGPGLSIVARDTFRVWVNGHLIAVSESAREPLFIPLTLPPGENVIAIAVAADAGPAAALVQLDELERSWVSSSDWKVSAEPNSGWQDAGFDGEDWDNAEELATLGNLPGCDPEQNFPASSSARWIGNSAAEHGQIALRKTISVAPVGFGAGTTGGAEAEPTLVSTWSELEALADSDEPALLVLAEGVHDFRKTGDEVGDVEVCPTECPSDSTKTLYQVLVGETTCPNALVTVTRNDRLLRLRSNKTLVGLGRGASLRGVTVDLQESDNVIVRNLAVFDVNPSLLEAGDAFTLTQPSQVWIDHATVKWVSDGFTDVLAGTHAVTLSYLHYDGQNDAACDGQHRGTSQINDAEVTIHHSRYDHVSSRAPLAVGPEARVHLFNDVFSNVRDWAVGSTCSATALVEGSTFENVDAVTRYSTCPDTGEIGFLNLPAGSNLYRDGSPVFLGGDDSEPHDAGFSPPYEYTIEVANEAWPEVISRAGAGGLWAVPLTLD